MRDLIRQVVSGYKSLKLEGQDEGYVVFTGKEPGTRQAVSIKILPRLLGPDPKIASQFDKVARTIRQLNHPNIASIRTVGEESGLPYVITRAIEKAQPLTARLNQPWAVDTAADVVMQVGQALEHAYKKGIVHGNLTPENVVVEEDGQVQVTDFGMNELMDLVGGGIQQATSPFLAPERMSGEKADASTDVYSLAALLYSMLANRPPQVVNGQVVPPSQFNPDVPKDMDKVIVKALAPDPVDRYPDAKMFLGVLGAISLVSEKDEAPPVSASERCSKCGAMNQSSRFCRKCGTRLDQPKAATAPRRPKSKLDEPIQVTKVEVGKVKVGKGVKVRPTVIARPMMVASGELLTEFPEPLEMPQVDREALMSEMGSQSIVAMPELPPMPIIDWAEVAPPVPMAPIIESVPLSPDD